MIDDLKLDTDTIGFPVVTWCEDRNAHGPEAYDRATLECRIMKAGNGLEGIAEGALMFVAIGSVREGAFEKGKPWEYLSGFAVKGAEVFAHPGERTLLEVFTEMVKHPLARGAAKQVAHDKALVIEAQFGPFGRPIYVNCADASRVDVNQLHALLVRQFVAARGDYLTKFNRSRFIWPKGDERLPTFNAGNPGWQDSRARSFQVDVLAWAMPAAAASALVGLVLWWVLA